jgi:hypothetical protein
LYTRVLYRYGGNYLYFSAVGDKWFARVLGRFPSPGPPLLRKAVRCRRTIVCAPATTHPNAKWWIMTQLRNVLGGPLEVCCSDPVTGFYRTGRCQSGPDDVGVHAVCARMTEEFLDFSRATGNDLRTPNPAWGFPGLSPGDRWCLCASRWREANVAGVAPPVILAATHERALEVVSYLDLLEHAIDPVGESQGRG